jgi:hypothetical protein
MEEATLELEFLKETVPIIQHSRSSWKQAADSQLLVDMLKWKLLDAPNMSLLRRAWARRKAKPDPMYDRPVPLQLTHRQM